MAKALGTSSILMPDSSRFLHPFGSRHLNQQQSVSIVRGYAGFSSSLQIIYKESKACSMTSYVCRSQSSASLTSPETKRAFILVYDKSNLSFLGLRLLNLGYTIVSTGGTATALEKAGVPVTRPKQLTDYRELLDSHVKQRDQKQHIEQQRSGTDDIVVVNSSTFFDEVYCDVLELCMFIYAFTMCRDALVVVDPQDYCSLLAHLEGKLQDKKFCRKLARKAYEHGVSLMSPNLDELLNPMTNLKSPTGSVVPFYLQRTLCYEQISCSISATTIKHHGKEMSSEDYETASAAWNCVSDFVDPTCVVVKHTNPRGVASRDDILEAYKLAMNASNYSCPWYGGILSFNVEVDESLASQIRESLNPPNGQKIVYETVVVAPAYSKKGLEILCGMSKNLRVLEAKKSKTEKDEVSVDIQFTTVSNQGPTEMELDDVKFAWRCVKHQERNAVIVVKNKCLLGVAKWLPNGLAVSLRTAMREAGEEAKGAILASDAFFPVDWKDALKEVCEGGVSVIVGPGGSIGDTDAIDCCNDYGVSLVFME